MGKQKVEIAIPLNAAGAFFRSLGDAMETGTIQLDDTVVDVSQFKSMKITVKKNGDMLGLGFTIKSEKKAEEQDSAEVCVCGKEGCRCGIPAEQAVAPDRETEKAAPCTEDAEQDAQAESDLPEKAVKECASAKADSKAESDAPTDDDPFLSGDDDEEEIVDARIPEEADAKAGGKPKYKALKKRMKRPWKNIVADITAGRLPGLAEAEPFLADCELMTQYPGKGDDFYADFDAITINLRQALEKQDLQQAQKAVEEMNSLTKACHSRYK